MELSATVEWEKERRPTLGGVGSDLNIEQRASSFWGAPGEPSGRLVILAHRRHLRK